MDFGMKRIYLLLVSAIYLMMMPSCETDFDVSAEPKDITIVYGLISPNDSVHYLRINKAFLGEGNYLEYAQIEDSSSYFNNLEVYLTEVSKNGTMHRIDFDTVHIEKEPGTFSQSSIAYKAIYDIPEDLSDMDYEYSLMIKNKLTGKEITSSTKLVKDFSITTPRIGMPNIDFISLNNQSIKWRSAKDGRRYDVFVRFYFTEVFNETDTTQRYIDWTIGTERSKQLNGGEELSVLYKPTSFYPICSSLIPYKDGREANVTARLTDYAEFTVVASGDEFNTYMEVNGPASGIVQDKPEYTNILNGLGIFSTRYSQLVSIPVGAKTEALLMDIPELKFVDKLGN